MTSTTSPEFVDAGLDEGVEAAFAQDGPLAHRLEGYQPRAQQLSMAEAVGATIEASGVLVCEAGTGTGKTLAYLVPAVLSGKRVIISSATRNLQEQLFHRDLPLVLDALGVRASTALLKGRANYLCRQRLRDTSAAGHYLDAEIEADLEKIRAWAATTECGDIAELSELAEDAPAWRYATSTADNCLGQECPAFAQCHVVKARRRAIDVDVLVVNHHLFFADMVLREEGFGELLPGADVVVLDEAHQLPEIATRFFGTSLGSAQIAGLVRDADNAHVIEAGDQPALPAATAAVQSAVSALRGALGSGEGRVTWAEVAEDTRVRGAVDALADGLHALVEVSRQLAERGPLLEASQRRAQICHQRLVHLCALEAADGNVRWLERQARGFVWHSSPLEVGTQIAARVYGQACAWVLTSATLAVGGRLDHFVERLGLQGADARVWDSPFDYERQALCYLPEALPDPRSAHYTEAMLEATVAVLEASRGRAFVLFTSHRALQHAAQFLPSRVEFPLFVQGQAPRAEVLERFRHSASGVLLGTHSFWEGVDVRGEALSCVIIDKLPFASPGDPLLRARMEHLRSLGRDPFVDYQLPQAVITLKQGVGRLIRDPQDRGVIVLCDPRVLSKGYGRVFVQSLPPMPVSRELASVGAFFRRH